MTPFLAELEQQLRAAAEREVASGRSGREVMRRNRLSRVVRGLPAATGIGVAVLVFALAVLFLHHSPHRPHPPASGARPPAGAVLPVGAPAGPSRAGSGTAARQIEQNTLSLAAEASDLHGGLPWGLETFRMTDGQTCLLAGREQTGRVGVIGEDGTFHNDGRFHPFTRYTPSSYCGQTDGDGNAFIDVSEPTTVASGNDQGVVRRGCRPFLTRARQAPATTCRPDDERQLEYGLLGPNATSITYRVDGRARTISTGPGGAFIVVGPPTKASFAASVFYQLMPGMVTAVHYRNGSTCRPHPGLLPRDKSLDCAPVGYVAPSHPLVTSAMVRAPVTATVTTAKRWCNHHSGYYIACNRRVPAGYNVLPGPAAGMVLLQWSWIARVPASGTNDGYEFAIKSGRPCGGGESSSGPIAARRGQRIVQQSLGSSPCGQRDTITVEYRTNVGPGGANFANPPNPGHDGQPLVGSTTIYVPR